MVSDLFFYQLGLIALVWLCCLLHWVWPSDRPRLPLRIREILYGSMSGGAESHTLLSSTHPHNELMRL